MRKNDKTLIFFLERSLWKALRDPFGEIPIVSLWWLSEFHQKNLSTTLLSQQDRTSLSCIEVDLQKWKTVQFFHKMRPKALHERQKFLSISIDFFWYFVHKNAHIQRTTWDYCTNGIKLLRKLFYFESVWSQKTIQKMHEIYLLWICKSSPKKPLSFGHESLVDRFFLCNLENLLPKDTIDYLWMDHVELFMGYLLTNNSVPHHFPKRHTCEIKNVAERLPLPLYDCWLPAQRVTGRNKRINGIDSYDGEW